MSYACDCSIDGDDDCTMFVQREVVARKPHRCCECWATIKAGERHEVSVGKWDGRFDHFRTCLPCSRIRQDYCGAGYQFEALQDQLYDCLGFNYVTGYDPESEEP